MPFFSTPDLKDGPAFCMNNVISTNETAT